MNKILLKDYINLIEKKDHLIKKLNMTDEQKDEVIEYFNKFPHAENKIDWNNKDLTYSDFKKIMNKVSKTQKKKLVKQKGIKGLIIDKDYLDLGVYNGYTAYVPLTYEASKLIASSNIGNVEGKWCTAYQKEDEYWFDYTDKGIVLVYFVKENDKIALAYSIDSEDYEIYDRYDNKVYEDDIDIDIDSFLNENREALDKANKKILDSDERVLKRKEEEFKEAIDNNNIKKVKELIKWGVDPSANDNSAIQWASCYGYTEIVKLLLNDKRVDPSADDNYAIKWASAYGHTEVVKLLLADKRVDPSADNNYAIQLASDNGHTEVVKMLLSDSRVDPTVYDNYTIRWASRYGHTEIVKMLLSDSRVDPSDNDNYAIRWASENGHTEIVKMLLSDSRVDPSAKDNYAIRWASENGHTEVVKLLIADPRVDPTADDNYAILVASRNGHTEIVKLLLTDERVDPTVDDNDVIRIASINGRTEVVKLLLADKRVDPSAVNNLAIRWASRKGHTEVVKLLLQHPKVKETLSKEDYEKYSKKAGLQTESLEDIVKNTVLKTIKEYIIKI